VRITVLGPGCRNCALLEKRVRDAVEGLGLDAQIDKVTDYDEILAWGVLATPGLAVDGRVVISGKVPTTSAIAQLITT
jgi:small redox-active disulfide protein 2